MSNQISAGLSPEQMAIILGKNSTEAQRRANFSGTTLPVHGVNGRPVGHGDQNQVRGQLGSGAPTSTTGSVRMSDPSMPQVTNTQTTDKLNDELASIQNRGLDRSALSLLKFPTTIEVDSTPYVLIKIFKSAVGTIQQTEEGDPTNSIVAGVEYGLSGIDNAVASSTVASSAADKAKQLLSGATNSLTELTGNTFNVGAFATKAKDILTNFALRRNIEQLSYAIAMTMPENLAVSYQNNFDQLSLTSALGGFGLAAQALASTDGKGENANPFIAEAAGRAINLFSDDFKRLGLFATTGRTVNPQLELIYNSPGLRQFTLDFRLIPRNLDESTSIGAILQVLKMQAAPQISSGTSSRYFIPPSQFQLEFYDGVNHGYSNPFLFKTKKCVLEDISIDYSGGGSFATFYTGAPVEIRLSLRFTETVIIDQTAVAEGF